MGLDKVVRRDCRKSGAESKMIRATSLPAPGYAELGN